jgi:putative hemolysin
MAELGRACIDPQWRRAGVAAKLSHSLLRFVQDNRLECVVAGASVPMYDGGQLAARLWRQLLSTVPVALDEQVRPRLPLPVDRLQTQAPVAMPALILCYLRFGARLIGPPAWNIDSGSAELPMMLRLADLPHLRRRPFPGR